MGNISTAPLSYIKWGLIWDLKTKRGDFNTYILRQLLLKQEARKILILIITTR